MQCYYVACYTLYVKTMYDICQRKWSGYSTTLKLKMDEKLAEKLELTGRHAQYEIALRMHEHEAI